MVGEKYSVYFEKEASMDSFAVVLPTPSYSSMYYAIYEKNESRANKEQL
jgi:hypothetical protein